MAKWILTEIKKFKNNKELEFHRKFEGNIQVRIKQNLKGSDKYSEFNLDRKNQKARSHSLIQIPVK